MAKVLTNDNDKGTFTLPVTDGRTLAASTDLVDLWPFEIPVDDQAELKMPEKVRLF